MFNKIIALHNHLQWFEDHDYKHYTSAAIFRYKEVVRLCGDLGIVVSIPNALIHSQITQYTVCDLPKLCEEYCSMFNMLLWENTHTLALSLTGVTAYLTLLDNCGINCGSPNKGSVRYWFECPESFTDDVLFVGSNVWVRCTDYPRIFALNIELPDYIRRCPHV